MYVPFLGQHTRIAQAHRDAFFSLNKLTSNYGWTLITYAQEAWRKLD